jgi:hypothetical protein
MEAARLSGRKLQTEVVLSTTESEYGGLSESPRDEFVGGDEVI